MSRIRQDEIRWAKRVWGPAWKRAWEKRRGNGSMLFSLATFRAGWWAGFGAGRLDSLTDEARRSRGK